MISKKEYYYHIKNNQAIKMKIDAYCDGDPWNPRTWSLTPLELVTTLKKYRVLNNTYDINPERDEYRIKRLIKNLRFLTLRRNGIRIKIHHPEFLRKRIFRLQKEADKIYNSHPKPDAIIMIAKDVSFKNTPFYTFQDLDIDTIIQWRTSKKKMFMFGRDNMEILKLKYKTQLNVYEKASGIFVASDWIAKNIKSYIKDPKKVYSVGIGHRYLPINLTDEILEKRFEDPKLLFVGKQFVRKGMNFMLEAFDIIREDIPKIQFTLITEEAEIPNSKLLAIKRDPNILLKPPIPAEKLRENFLNSSLFVMPSLFEPWGKVFLEAMSFGLPVIGANCCAMPEFIINNYNGYVVNHEPEEIAERICSLLNSFENYKKYSKNALKMSEKFKWENIVKKILKIIMRYQ